MKIRSDMLVREEKTIDVNVIIKGKPITFTLSTIDGKVKGNEFNGIATSYLTYFHETSDELQKKYFNQIKKHIELNYD